MIPTEHQKILRRVRRSAEKRGYCLKRFEKGPSSAKGTDYKAYDRYNRAAYVMVTTFNSTDPIEKGGDHHEVLTDSKGYWFSVLYMGQRELGKR